MIETASRSHLATPTTKSYVLTTLAKLTSRFGDEHKPRIEEMIGGFKTSMSLELQQRSCEVVVVRGAPRASSLLLTLARVGSGIGESMEASGEGTAADRRALMTTLFVLA